MNNRTFIHRVILRHYKSIGYCDVSFQPLTYLVSGNGSEKSNFLDALHIVKDALGASLDDDRPATKADDIKQKAAQVIPHRQVSVVLANRDDEAWSIAAAPSQHGFRGLAIDHSIATIDPERIRYPLTRTGPTKSGLAR